MNTALQHKHTLANTKLHNESIDAEAVLKSRDLITQCTKCKTRFYIEEAALSKQKSPYFHCSKCGNLYFDNALSYLVVTNRVVTTRERAASTKVQGGEVPLDNTSARNEMNLKTNNGKEVVAKQPELRLITPSTDNNSVSNKNASSNITGFETVPMVSHFDDEVRPVNTVINIAAQEKSTKHSSVSATSKFNSFKKNLLSRKTALSANRQNSAKSEDGQYPQLSLDLHTPKITLIRKIEHWFSQSLKNSWRAAAILALPIIALLILLATVTFILSPQSKTKLFSYLPFTEESLVDMPVVAPAGLIVQDTKFRPVVLDNGETVYVVSGKVINTTDKALHDIKVEGLAFDSRGDLIKSSIAALSSPLNSARLRALSVDEIYTLQISKKDGQNFLKPGDNQNFTLAISENSNYKSKTPGVSKATLKLATYFSARVYSVNE